MHFAVTMNKNIGLGLICFRHKWYEWSAMFVSVVLIGWQGIDSGHQWSPPTAVVGGSQDVPLCGGSHQPETGGYSGGGTPRRPELPLPPPAIPALGEPPPVPAQRSASLAPRTRITRGCWRSVNSQSTKHVQNSFLRENQNYVYDGRVHLIANYTIYDVSTVKPV